MHLQTFTEFSGRRNRHFQNLPNIRFPFNATLWLIQSLIQMQYSMLAKEAYVKGFFVYVLLMTYVIFPHMSIASSWPMCSCKHYMPKIPWLLLQWRQVSKSANHEIKVFLHCSSLQFDMTDFCLLHLFLLPGHRKQTYSIITFGNNMWKETLPELAHCL